MDSACSYENTRRTDKREANLRASTRRDISHSLKELRGADVGVARSTLMPLACGKSIASSSRWFMR
jgi:hypothetical protein